MARLFSHHDRFHVHAILGALALVHFLVRFVHLLLLTQDSFVPDLLSAATLVVHLLLHVTSFQFELPRNRMWTKPMIWREFRVHNAIFAYRNLLGTILGTWFPDWWWRNPMTVSSIGVKVALVLCTCKAAEIATDRIGDTEKRTTNAMPYPKAMSDNFVKAAKHYYAKAQFAATALAVFGIPMLSFCSILAIEIASFLMTLVRKGLIEARTYHILYAVSLFVMLPSMLVSLHCMANDMSMATFRAMIATTFSCTTRMQMGWGKYSTWTLAVIAGPITAEALAMFIPISLVAWTGILWSVFDTYTVLAKKEDSPMHVVEKVSDTSTEGSVGSTCDRDSSEDDIIKPREHMAPSCHAG